MTNTSKRLAMLLCVALLLALCPAQGAFAAVGDTFEENGVKYTVLTETPERTAAVSGWGMGGAQATLTIPATAKDGGGNEYKVTEIANNAFFNETDVTTLDIAGAVNLVTIGESAFGMWRNLTANGLDLSGLTNLTTIGVSAFSFCGFTGALDLSGLTSLATIGDSAFSNCGFTGALDLSGLTSLATIGEDAFEFCDFAGALDLSGLTNLTAIGESAFRNCGFTGARLPAWLTIIPKGLFANCSNLASVEFSPNLTSIGNSAFQNCAFTGTLDLSGYTNLATIDISAFYNCDSLTDVRFPAGLTSIGNQAFLDCNTLATMWFYGNTAPALGGVQVFQLISSTGTVYYPDGGTGYTNAAFEAKGLPDTPGWIFTPLADMTKPVLAAGTIARTSAAAATVTFTSSKSGTYYYAVVAKGAIRPAIPTTGAGTACGTTQQTISLDALATGDAYDIYIVVKDATGNLSDPLKIEIPVKIEIPEHDSPTKHPDYIIDYTPTDPTYTQRTFTDHATGVTVSGQMTIYAKLTVRERVLHTEGACPACEEIRARMAAGEVIVLYDISISGGYTGELEVSIPVGEQYNGQTVIILHCNNGMLESVTCVVQNGAAKGAFKKLYPFAVVRGAGVGMPENTVVDPPQTGDAPTGGIAGVGLGLCALGLCALGLCALGLVVRRRHTRRS